MRGLLEAAGAALLAYLAVALQLTVKDLREARASRNHWRQRALMANMPNGVAE